MWQPFHDSKYNRTCSGIDIRSPLINVRILLSSITEFMLSIHNVSTGPSNIIHFSSGFSSKWKCTKSLKELPVKKTVYIYFFGLSARQIMIIRNADHNSTSPYY